MEFNIEQIKNVLSNKGYDFFDDNKPYNINIIGVRGEYGMSNSFDDSIYVIYRDEQLELKIHEFAITTDPVIFWQEDPSKVSGDVTLVPGQYVSSHSLGLDQGKYLALKQKRNMSVWRSKFSDSMIDKGGEIYKGVYGMNIHKSSASESSSTVERWSAGCQVFEKDKDFTFLMDLCQKSAKLYGNSFTYTLLERDDFY